MAEPHGWGISMSTSGELQRAQSAIVDSYVPVAVRVARSLCTRAAKSNRLHPGQGLERIRYSPNEVNFAIVI